MRRQAIALRPLQLGVIADEALIGEPRGPTIDDTQGEGLLDVEHHRGRHAVAACRPGTNSRDSVDLHADPRDLAHHVAHVDSGDDAREVRHRCAFRVETAEAADALPERSADGFISAPAPP